MTNENIRTLRAAYTSCIMENSGSALASEMKNTLTTEYEKKLEGVHKRAIYQIGDGRWKTSSPQIARQTREELIEALYDHYFGIPKKAKKSLEAVYKIMIEETRKRVLQGHSSPDNLRTYQREWKRFLEGSALSKMDIESITQRDLFEFYADITSGQTITRKTLGNVKTVLNKCFEICPMLGLNVIDSRAVKTGSLMCKFPTETEPFSDTDREKILSILEQKNDVYSHAIQLLFCLCIRIGELEALQWNDIDFDKKIVKIRKSRVDFFTEDEKIRKTTADYTKGKKMSGKRILPLSKRALMVLEKRREVSNSDYVFTSKIGKPLSTEYVNNALKKACILAGVTYRSSHKARFWSITHMYESGIDLATIQKAAGHSSPRMTEHYIRMSTAVGIDADSLFS